VSILADVLAANELYAETYVPSAVRSVPARHVAILACMDARLDVFALLGLRLGDAHVIRNAGGRVTDDVIRSLTISEHVLDTREIVVIHHTDCGLLTNTNDMLREVVERGRGVDASALDFLPFHDLEQSVIDDVAALRQSPYLRLDATISGMVFDVETGRLRLVA
jgi:carbonic anhydrase